MCVCMRVVTSATIRRGARIGGKGVDDPGRPSNASGRLPASKDRVVHINRAAAVATSASMGAPTTHIQPESTGVPELHLHLLQRTARRHRICSAPGEQRASPRQPPHRSTSRAQPESTVLARSCGQAAGASRSQPHPRARRDLSAIAQPPVSTLKRHTVDVATLCPSQAKNAVSRRAQCMPSCTDGMAPRRMSRLPSKRKGNRLHSAQVRV